MNGVHDLGGMQGFGPVRRETDEKAFHAPWEAVVLAIRRSRSIVRLFTIDEFRHTIERMEPARYLGSTYYERWLDALVRVLIDKGVLTPDELEARERALAQRPAGPAPQESSARDSMLPGGVETTVEADGPVIFVPASPVRPATTSPRYVPGDGVRTRVIHPTGHTRLPRYARGKPGVIDRLHGTHVFPDANAHGHGERPQPLYSVAFEARALWGESAEPNQRVFLDLWESYLEPVAGVRGAAPAGV